MTPKYIFSDSLNTKQKTGIIMKRKFRQ